MIDALYIATALQKGPQDPSRVQKAKALAQQYGVKWADVQALLDRA